MNKRCFRYIVFLLALIFIVASFDTVSEAAAKEVKTKITDSYSEKNIIKKAPRIKKGTTIVTASKKKTCYVKFTATATKTYKFTFTPKFTEEQNEDFMLGYFQICRIKYGKLSTQKLKTKGGKYIALNVGNQRYIDAIEVPKNKAKAYMTSRSTSIKLKKGETIIISSYIQKNQNEDKLKYKVIIK